jgi:hypothetical protein
MNRSKYAFEDGLELKICPDEQAYAAEHKISIDIMDSMICKEKIMKG